MKNDAPSLTAYAVDASIYRMTPQAVVLVESEGDIQTVIRYAVTHGIPLTPRAAGTNLTGSAIGSGIILDVSRMNRVIEVNREEQWARVQPGIVLAEFNKQLAQFNLMFGPDPSSGDMCKLGGMVANNSSGPHTLRYGSVKDNVHSLRVCLHSGEWIDAHAYSLIDTIRRTSADDARAAPPGHDSCAGEQGIHSRETTLCQQEQLRLQSLWPCRWPGSWVCSILPKLFVGSEGTLGVISEAKMRLAVKPAATLTAMIHFRHLEEVGQAVPELLTLKPSALEVMDANTLDLIGRRRHGIPEHSAATLLAELEGLPGEIDLRSAPMTWRRFAGSTGWPAS